MGTDGFYLVDSGGQYYEGTTDVTRTIAVGHVTDEMKEHFTLVMMGMLRLMNAKFLYGLPGSQCGLPCERTALGAGFRLQPRYRTWRWLLIRCP